MAADLVTIATTAILTQFLTPAAKNLGEVALERAKQIGSKAVGYLTAVGREAQPVEEKVLYPLLQAASLESDPTLIEKWAALLANAADPIGQIEVTPIYSDILRQLTRQEAKVLNILFAEVYEGNSSATKPEPYYDQASFRRGRAIDRMLDMGLLYHLKVREQSRQLYSEEEAVERSRFDAIVDRLLRQQILILAKGEPLKAKSPSSSDFKPDTSKAFFTSLGYDFMLAVTPPTP